MPVMFSAMSYGSISYNAHACLARAARELGICYNTGEGGLHEDFYAYGENTIVQVASGRFGVHKQYLEAGAAIEIKMGQGAKPGIGGHLPGAKIVGDVSRTRMVPEGTDAISPAPHHDIYSIEDLRQLVFSLKEASRYTKPVIVKIAAVHNVAAIASGIARSGADIIAIDGFRGGTGAAPRTSIHNAGLPWELGVAEAHQTLSLNGLRSRVAIEADGKLMDGTDVAVACLLGAEEFGFATSALIVLGCVMMRKCHMNTCPVGVATQDEELRKRFHGRHEYLVNFFTFLAREVREYLAELGYTKLDDIIGRTDLLMRKPSDHIEKHDLLDLSRLIHLPEQAATQTIHQVTRQLHAIDNVKDVDIIRHAKAAIESGQEVSLDYAIANTDRSVGAMLSGEIAKRYGNIGLPENTLHIKFKGAAGQSFGAFLAHGVHFRLEGEANDYLGKGLSGGHICLMPPVRSTFIAEDNTIAGNTLLYGATSGEVYINGRVGERFCVRNSGAIAVVEGVGDHCCEYMTGGRVVVLGNTGRNFAAGMSGGVAYVWNKNGDFDYYCNMEMVELSLIEDSTSRKELHELIRKHYHHTGSHLAGLMLDNWNKYVDEFIQIVPIEYKKVLQEEQMRKLQRKIAEMQKDY